MGARRKFTHDQMERFKAMWLNHDIGIDRIRTEFGCGSDTVARLAKELGLPSRAHRKHGGRQKGHSSAGEKLMKPTPGQAKKRPCIRCGTKFLSLNFGNRMCRPCRTKAGDEVFDYLW